ncbi:MAG: hypothetical protein ABIO75_08550 [Thermomonas sp.]
MRPLFTSALAAAIAMAVLPAIPQRAEAGTGVLRCEMPDGTSAYTNKGCGALGAKSTPLSADVLARIASDQRHQQELVALQSGIEADVTADTSDDAQTLVPLRRPVARGCATTPQQLALDLQGSVALKDVNRVAESFDWAGMGNEQAQRIMARLEQVAQRSVRDAEYFDARIGQGASFADAGMSSVDGAAGLLQVTFDAGNGNSIVDFDVRRVKGCYFLHY